MMPRPTKAMRGRAGRLLVEGAFDGNGRDVLVLGRQAVHRLAVDVHARRAVASAYAQHHEWAIAAALESVVPAGGHENALVSAEYGGLALLAEEAGFAVEHDEDVVLGDVRVQLVLAALGIAFHGHGHLAGLGHHSVESPLL